MEYHFKVHRAEEGGYWAHDLDPGLGIVTQGETLEQLKANLKEALDLALDEPEDSRWIPPAPRRVPKADDIVAISVEPHIALASTLRVNRVRNGWSQREAAARLGMRHVRQYQVLESSRTANPEFATLVKLKRAFPRLSLDAVIG